MIRGGAPKEEILTTLAAIWRQRNDRGAEERTSMSERRALVPVEQLRKDPHLEMHTRGG